MGECWDSGVGFSWTPAAVEAARQGKTLGALIRVFPAHPANAVKAVFSIAGGPDREVRANPVGLDPASGAQIFALALPEPPPGTEMVWRPVLLRSGRSIDPKQKGVPPDRVGAVPPPPSEATSTPVTPSHPARFPLEPVFLFRVTAPVYPDDDPVGETPDGLRLLFALRDGGTVRGPGLNGDILHKGGDWMRVRPDGVGVCAIDALIRIPDRGIVQTEYNGMVDFGPDGYAQLARGGGPRRAPLRFAPRYLTAIPELKWINRLQCFSIGEVDLQRHIVEYDLYAFGPIDRTPG